MDGVSCVFCVIWIIFMAVKNKFYAVAAGRTPGLYTDWSSAKIQVDGFAGAKYKGFSLKEEALAWLENSGLSQPRKVSCHKESTVSSSHDFPDKNIITIFTDGGARNNPGPGGYGCVLMYKGHQKELSGGFQLTTNNRMELMACIVALREIKDRSIPVILHSDSSYVVNGINKGWARNWQRNGWVKSDNKPAVNPDLWSELLDLTESLNITFKWVKGHAGNPLNERCDELAVASSRMSGLPVDTGYKG
jgi:ribonuclease HI